MRKGYLILLVLVFFFGCSYPVKNLDSKGKNIICFGDSITSGEGLSRKEEAFPSILAEFLGREVINSGRAGDTTSSAFKRLEKDVLSKDPYMVILELGGNDFLQRIPLETSLKNLEKIILKIQERGAICVLIDISCGFLLSSYRKAYQDLAQKTGSIFVPGVFRGIFDDASLKVDFLHPNPFGHKIIAQRIYKAIRFILKKQGGDN